jgi:hypothetical protein
MTTVPQPIIILMPTMGTGWIRGARNIRTPPFKPRNPNKPVRPIPVFDREALRRRAMQFIERNKLQRESLRAAAWSN